MSVAGPRVQTYTVRINLSAPHEILLCIQGYAAIILRSEHNIVRAKPEAELLSCRSGQRLAGQPTA